jgi:hypothetical protein
MLFPTFLNQIWNSTRTTFHGDLRKTPIDLHLEMRRFSQLITVILTLIWQHWFEIAQERFNSSVGTKTCQRKFPNSSLTPVTPKTNEVGQFVLDIRPIYPFNASEIPSDTAAHLKATQRESPLVTAGVAESFKRSKIFTLEIQDVVAEGSERGICTVYRCQITSIDNVPVSLSSLCLKLFDDRFQPLQSPDEDDEELNDDTLP